MGVTNLSRFDELKFNIGARRRRAVAVRFMTNRGRGLRLRLVVNNWCQSAQI